MHTGKYEKLRFRNICRVCEAAGWAAECPGPRSSPTTAEWRVMRILFPSVSRHSPSSTPTFFILASHHTNSYGHKIEREGKMTERAVHRLPRLAVFDFRHLPATHDWQSRWHNSPSPSCSSLLSLPTLNQHPCQHCQLLAHTDTHTHSHREEPPIGLICWWYQAKLFIKSGSWRADGGTVSSLVPEVFEHCNVFVEVEWGYQEGCNPSTCELFWIR